METGLFAVAVLALSLLTFAGAQLAQVRLARQAVEGEYRRELEKRLEECKDRLEDCEEERRKLSRENVDLMRRLMRFENGP